MNKILALLRALFSSGSNHRHGHGVGTGYHQGELGSSYDRGRDEYFEEEGSDCEGEADAPQEDQPSEEEYVEDGASTEEGSPSDLAEEEAKEED